jgi:hypothetical protein
MFSYQIGGTATTQHIQIQVVGDSVLVRLGTNSKIRRITAIIRRDYLPNHYSRRSEYWVITRRIFANY